MCRASQAGRAAVVGRPARPRRPRRKRRRASTRTTSGCPGVESQRAVDLLKERFPEAPGTSAQLVFHVEDGGVLDGGRADAIAAVVAEAETLPHVASITDPTTAAQPRRHDPARAGPVRRRDDGPRDRGPRRAVDAGRAAEDVGVQVEVGGELPQYAEQGQTRHGRGHRPARRRGHPARSPSARSWPWACRSASPCSASASASTLLDPPGRRRRRADRPRRSSPR